MPACLCLVLLLATSSFPDPGLWKRLCGNGLRDRGLWNPQALGPRQPCYLIFYYLCTCKKVQQDRATGETGPFSVPFYIARGTCRSRTMTILCWESCFRQSPTAAAAQKSNSSPPCRFLLRRDHLGNHRREKLQLVLSYYFLLTGNCLEKLLHVVSCRLRRKWTVCTSLSSCIKRSFWCRGAIQATIRKVMLTDWLTNSKDAVQRDEDRDKSQ